MPRNRKGSIDKRRKYWLCNLLESYVEKFVKEMQNGKATGRDKIQIELIKALKIYVKENLIRLCNEAYEEGNKILKK